MATLAAPGVSATARSRADVTDHDLVQAVRAGDDHAFERLYHRYHRRISAYVYGMVRDHGRAEDLTQEIFVSALRRMRQTDRPIAFKPWIYEIAKNACIDAFRRSRRTEEVSYDAEEALGAGDQGRLIASGPSPDAAADTRQQLQHLCGAFGGLSEAHHQILVMRELEGLSYREIGERLGMSRPSVESTLFRARRRLTEEYEELVTGERCQRIQAIIAASAGQGALGLRDQRRVGSHITHCRPCRRQACLAGLDAAALARRPVRARIAALLPLPAFLRRRWLPGDDGGATSSAAAHHGSALAQLSATASQYGDSAVGGWAKAAAVALAVAAAGVGAGSTVTHHASAAPKAASPGAHRSASHAHRAAATHPATSSGVTRTRATSGTTRAAERHHARRTTRSAIGGGGGGSASGTHGGASSSGGGGGSGTQSAGSRTAGSTGTTGSASTVTDAASGAVDQATSTADTAAGTLTGTSTPLIDPDPTALVPSTSTAQAPTSGGSAVQTVTDTVGDTVGGSAGQAVKDTGTTVGQTVDQVTQTATGLLGGS